MKKFLAALLLVAIILLPQLSQKSYALSCAEPDLPHIEYDKHDAVIIGTVIAIEEQSEANTKLLTVEVDKSYKGIDTKLVTIEEMLMWSESYVDQSYLFFLIKVEDKWINSLCGPTTSNIALADQYLSDKTELQLIENEIVEEKIIVDKIERSPIHDETTHILQNEQLKSSSKHTTTIIVIVIALFLIVITAVFVLKKKSRL